MQRPSRPGTKAVLLDFGGTLDADGLSWNERFFALWRDAGVVAGREEFNPIFYAADDSLVGTIPREFSFADTVRCLTALVADALQVRDGRITDRVARQFLEDALGHLRRNAPLLARLTRRFRLGLVSNFYGNLETVCDNTAIQPFFGVIVDSVHAGLTKPDPRIFMRALDELGVPPADATFVGDSAARDMAGARALGMRHIWLTGDPAPPDGPCCPDDAVIHSLEEVEELLS
jgi:HAD superfamily hydrolase (TIGR01549 family)